MLKIKVGFSTGWNEEVEDIIEVEESEVAGLSAQEKQDFLDQVLREFIFDRIDSWAMWTEGEQV